AGCRAERPKRYRTMRDGSQAGQYDRYVMPDVLRDALVSKAATLGHEERQSLGFYHGYHGKRIVSRIWLDRWAARFPELEELVNFARTPRPGDGVRFGLDLPEAVHDLTAAA